MCAWVVRFLADDRGQDLIEYALVTTFVGLAAITAFPAITAAIANAYGVWNTSSNNLWYPAAPAGS